jgi:transcriptional regulator with PAS, ATPase and Fis domain
LGKVIKRAVILAEENGVITPERLVFDLAEQVATDKDKTESLPEMVRELERRVISDALEINSWNRKVTAGLLGISYPTLLKKIRDFNIERSN